MKKLLHMILDKIQTGEGNPESQLTIMESHLSGLSATVNALMYDAEQDFLTLYDKFQTLGTQTVELKEMIRQTTTLADGKDEELQLAGMNDFAKKSLDQLQSFQRDISDSLRILDSGWSHLEKLSSLCTEAETLTRHLNDMNLKNSHDRPPHEIIRFHNIVRQQLDHVQKVSLKFHKKALNAILNASHLNDMGHTLERFASESSWPACESTCSTTHGNALINKIRALTEKLQNRTPLNKGGAGLHDDSRPLSGSHTLFKANSSAASKMARKLETAIANTRFALSFIPDFSNRMALLLKQSEGVHPPSTLTRKKT